MKIQDLAGKKILLLGFGKEGRSTLAFLRKVFPGKKIGIADQKELSQFNSKLQEEIKRGEDLELFLGRDYLKSLSSFEVIIKSPGISPFFPQLAKAKEKITSQTKLFFANCPGKIVGITGTKGKSTTATLIYQVLKKGGIKVHLVGNIGRPPLNFLLSATEEDVFVYELSSHQLFDLQQSPFVAVLLNIFPEHLDYYPTYEEYIQAKVNITRFQGREDFFLYNFDQKEVREIGDTTSARKIPFSLERELSPGCFLKGGKIFCCLEQAQEIISRQEIPLLGRFNLYNVMSAVIVGRIFGVSQKSIRIAIREFKPLRHRLEKLGTFRGITFVDDSISTVPQTAIAALEAFRGKVGMMILGGLERYQDFGELAQKIWEEGIENLILFPSTGKRIWREIVKRRPKGKNLPRHFFVKGMKEAVFLAFRYTPKGKICLLSPASASFNLFRNYEERGNLFRKYIYFYCQTTKGRPARGQKPQV